MTIDTQTAGFSLVDASGKAVTPVTPLFPVSYQTDSCASQAAGTDVNNPQRTPSCPNGLKVADTAACCAACNNDTACVNWVFADASQPDPSGMNCWLLQEEKKKKEGKGGGGRRRRRRRRRTTTTTGRRRRREEEEEEEEEEENKEMTRQNNITKREEIMKNASLHMV